MKLQRILILLVACTAIRSLAHPVSAATYTIKDLGDLVGGTGVSHALDINNRGQVVGRSGNGTSCRPFLWDAAHGMQDLGLLPGSTSGEATAINESGQVIGNLSTNQTTNLMTFPFLWDPLRGMHDLGTATALIGDTRQPLRTTVSDINDLGQILGTGVHPVSDDGRNYLWDPFNGWQELPTPPFVVWNAATALNNLTQVVGSQNYGWWIWQPGKVMEFRPGFRPNDINDHSQVVNTSGVIGSSRAFLWDPATGQVDLGDAAGLDWSAALGINESGQVVGWWDRSPSEDRETFTAFVWDPIHGMQDLEVLSNAAVEGWQFQRAEAINDRGQIVGWGINAEGQEHAFLLSPVPERSSLLLLNTAAAAGVVTLRRRSTAVVSCLR